MFARKELFADAADFIDESRNGFLVRQRIAVCQSRSENLKQLAMPVFINCHAFEITGQLLIQVWLRLSKLGNPIPADGGCFFGVHVE